MELYIMKYKDDNPQGAIILNLGTITGSYNSYRNRLAGLIITNDQAKVIFYDRYTNMVNYDKSTDIEICGYPLDGSMPSSSFKVAFEKEIPIYKYHDSENLYLCDQSNTEEGGYFCQLIKMNIETGNKQIIFSDINIVAYGFDSIGHFIYLSYYKESKKNVYSVKKVSLSAPQQYIDKIFIPSMFLFIGFERRWDKELEKFIIPVYKSSPGSVIFDIYLLDLK